MPNSAPALAVIDGTLVQLTREGVAAGVCPPLATAIVEFRRGPMRVYVRELAVGLLPGIANLYCLDGALRLLWIAQWPADLGACTAIVDATDDALTVESAFGLTVRIDPHTGAVIGVDHQLAAAG
ncbi:MAG: hypothetical protein ABIZ04_25860 [Opitutus sp.]